MPILGIYASSAQPALNASSYESIATATGTGSSAVITFNSIPSTYKHLQLRIFTINSQYGTLKLNNDATASNYYSHYLSGTGANPATAGAFASVIYMPFGASTASYPFVEIVDFLDYANTNKYKTTRSLMGIDQNGSGSINLLSGLWQSTSAISRIDLTAASGNWATNSSFALYGVKG